MGIAFVGSHVGTHAATSVQSIAFTNLRDEANAQPTLAQGDLVVVAINQASTVDRTQAQLLPSGYTAAHTDLYQNDSNDTNLQVSYKVMGASPDTSVSIPASDSTANGVAYAIYVFRGIDTATPLDVTAITTGNTNTGIANANAITPSTAGAWIMAVGAAAVAAGAAFTNPVGMSATTNHFRSATITSTTVDANIGVALKTDWSSGAFDPAAFGGSTSTNTGSWAAVTLALRPLVATGDASGTITLTGSSAAVVAIAASGSGTLGLSGSSNGVVAVAAAASSALALTGSGSGTVTSSGATGDASGSIALTGSASGASAIAASASGSLAVSGAATATLALTGAGSGTFGLSGSAGASVALSGVGTGLLGLSGTGVGVVADAGASTGSLALTGSSIGAVALSGTASGALALTGDASGAVNNIPVDGSASGSLDLGGVAAAAAAVSGGATLTFSLDGSVLGTVEINGGATGALDLAGDAQGINSGSGIDGSVEGEVDLDGRAYGRLNAANDRYPLAGSINRRPLYGRAQAYPLRRAA